MNQYFALGAQYRALMAQPDRAAAVFHAQGAGANCGNLVTITVKDAEGADVVLKLDQPDYVSFLCGFEAY